MKKLFYILFLIPLLSFSQETITLVDADILAFPGAVGHGKNALGGRGLGVYFVINTNDGGAGSFEAALLAATAAGGGTVIFRTGGTVNYTDNLFIGSGSGAVGNITIAGQTAPGDGFAYRSDNGLSYRVWVRGSDIIVRHIASYGGNDSMTIGDTGPNSTTGIEYTMEDIMIDHVSLAGGVDEVVSITTKTNSAGTNVPGVIQNVSFINNIVTEPSTTSGGVYNMIMYGYKQRNISLIGNYFANSAERNISSNAPENTYEFINNLVYWCSNAFVSNPRQLYSIIGNYMDPGNGRSFNSGNTAFKLNPCTTDNCPPSGDSNYTGTQIHVDDNWDGELGSAALTDSDIQAYDGFSRQTSSGYVPHAASVVPDSIAANVGSGAGLSRDRNAYDQAQIDDFPNGGHTGSASVPNPTLAAGTPYVDTDSDGLSDAYESAQGGSPTSINRNARPATAVISNGNTVDQSGVTNYASEGYTHLDIFLADLANDWDSFASAPGGGPPAQGNESILKPHRVRFSNSTGAVYFGTTKIKG